MAGINVHVSNVSDEGAKAISEAMVIASRHAADASRDLGKSFVDSPNLTRIVWGGLLILGFIVAYKGAIALHREFSESSPVKHEVTHRADATTSAVMPPL